MDGHPVHRSKAVKVWVDLKRKRINLCKLTGYSPNLNPYELVNNDVKPNALGGRMPSDKETMVAGVRGFLRSMQKTTELVMRYFQYSAVAYAA